MKLTDILAISGQGGLFRFVAQSPRGIIVESLDDKRRMNVTGSTKVSSLGEISVYTDTEDKPLAAILQKIFDDNGGNEILSHKSSPAELKDFFNVIVPDYDRDMVHVSDMKKIVSWYNILVSQGMSDFTVEDPSEDEQSGGTEQ